MNYFVTIEGIEVASNLTKVQAIQTGKSKYKQTNCTLSIGIGKIKYVKGQKVYTLLPLHFYLN